MVGRYVDADVVVVGGGPAGSAAAIACATRGLGVILCERERIFRERPGETLHPGAEPLVAQLGLADRLAPFVHARHPGIWVDWNGKRRFEAFGADARGPWSGFHVWRADFDDMLLARAKEVGVEVRRPCGVSGVIAAAGEMCGVETARGPVAARVIVDASGRARWLGRALDVASCVRSPRLVARYGYAEGFCPSRDDAPMIKGDASGWTWTARVRDGTYQWTRLSLRSRPDANWMPEEFRGLRPRAASRGADVTWRIAERVARPGWFMVGDAAATLDPSSAHGVLKALMSGLAAGHLIAGALGGKLPPEAAALAYCQWLGGWFERDVAELVKFYRALDRSLFGGSTAG